MKRSIFLVFGIFFVTSLPLTVYAASSFEGGTQLFQTSNTFLIGDNTGTHFGKIPLPKESLLDGGIDSYEQGRIVVAQSRRELGQGVADNTLRIEQLQEQLRQLTGKLEQLLFENQRLQEQIGLMQEDTDTRLQELEGTGKRTDIQPQDEKNVARLDEGAVGGSQDDIAATIHENTGNQATNHTTGPLDLSKALGSRHSADANLPVSGDPLLRPNGIASLGTLNLAPDTSADALYDLGYNQLLNGDYELAEGNLRQFLQRYPAHALSPNARYWLGETYFARGQFTEAVKEFSSNYKTYPDSHKAPDSLLKMGISLARLQEKDAACATLAEMLNRFPNAPRSIQSEAREEQARSNCS